MEYKHFSLTHITYPKNDHIAPILALLSLTPPFVVCALCSSVLLYKDVVAAHLLIGLLLCAGVCSILKDLLQEPRPDRSYAFGGSDEEEMEYGMPSNHSAFSFFGAVFVVLYVLRDGQAWSWRLPSRRAYSVLNAQYSNGKARIDGDTVDQRRVISNMWHMLHTQVTILAVLTIASGCAYSRIYLGYHTTNQVLVGSITGVVLGAAWYVLFEAKCIRDWLEWIDWFLYELETKRLQCLLGKKRKDN